MANAVIIDDYRNRVAIPTAVDHPITHINYSVPISTVQQILPYRVRFTTITIEGPSSSSPPGIGLQIIGFSNWII